MRPVLASVAAALVLAPAALADTNADRAVASYAAMQRYLFDARSGFYRQTYPSTGRATVWPVSQALAASIAVASLPEASPALRRDTEERLARTLARYAWKGVAVRASLYPHADVFYDDNVWVALDLLDWYALTGDRESLAHARRLFGLVVSGWDGKPTDPCPGGVFWTRARTNRDRNAVTTAGGALLGMRLYALLHRPELLYWARRMSEWVDACLAAPDGLYSDHIDAYGSVDEREWSYNQGAMIGAEVLLAQTTGDASALARARQIADASLASIAFGAEPPEFAAIFFRNLLALAAATGDDAYRAAAQAYADAAWTNDRDPATGLFRSKPGRARLLEQAAITQVYALLAASGQ